MKNLDQLFSELLKLIQNTGTFINAETPDFIRQLLEYQAWTYTMNIWISSIGVIFLIFFLIMTVKLRDDFEIFSQIGSIFGIFFLIISMIIGFKSFYNLRKIEVAPKVYIVDYLSHKINGKNHE